MAAVEQESVFFRGVILESLPMLQQTVPRPCPQSLPQAKGLNGFRNRAPEVGKGLGWGDSERNWKERNRGVDWIKTHYMHA